MTWFKRDTDLPRSRKIRKLGKGARGLMAIVVWEHVLGLNAGRQSDVISESELAPELIADDLRWYGVKQSDVLSLVGAFVEVGLLERVVGGYRIVGWDDYRPRKSETEARRLRRKRPDKCPDNVRTTSGQMSGPEAEAEAEVEEDLCNARGTPPPKPAPSPIEFAGSLSAFGAGALPCTPAPTISAMLKEIGYFKANDRKRTATAGVLSTQGITLDDLKLVWAHANQAHNKNPMAVFATWLKGDGWRDALHEAQKARRQAQ